MVYIISTLIKKALMTENFHDLDFTHNDDLWKFLMLEPKDYSQQAIKDPMTNAIMDKVSFKHGGEEFDKRYPLGIPT